MQRLSPGRARDHPVMEKFLIKLSLSLSLRGLRTSKGGVAPHGDRQAHNPPRVTNPGVRNGAFAHAARSTLVREREEEEEEEEFIRIHGYYRGTQGARCYTDGASLQPDESEATNDEAQVLSDEESASIKSGPPTRLHLRPSRERERERERALSGTISITGWSRARPGDRRCLALESR